MMSFYPVVSSGAGMLITGLVGLVILWLLVFLWTERVR